ncbi:MAG: GntR family transcriptional regulator [Zetaproteobacteria bacterium]|nr:GntR family transcriptional regulator [Zetaproteobacteria bacterium]
MSAMALKIGRMNRLQVCKQVDFGIFLDGGDPKTGGHGNILMPMRYVPKDCELNDELDVFIYLDSEDRLIATSERPYAMVGECALLKVAEVTRHGIFLEWGLPKDLLLPFNEQITRMEAGKSYIVLIYLDDDGRIAASAKIDEFLHDVDDEGLYAVGEAVSLFNAAKTDLGYKMVVNDSHWGLLHRQALVRELRRGERLQGFIKQVRPDGKIDLCLHQKPSEKSDEVGEMILSSLESAGGFLPLNDKSDPELIKQRFGISKVMFKKAIGALYKQHEITIEKDGIHRQMR